MNKGVVYLHNYENYLDYSIQHYSSDVDDAIEPLTGTLPLI